MKRALSGFGLLALLIAMSGGAAADQPDTNKVLRYAFEVAETSMDPHKVSDVYSTILNNGVFDAPRQLIGKRQGLEDSVEAATSKTALAAIVW